MCVPPYLSSMIGRDVKGESGRPLPPKVASLLTSALVYAHCRGVPPERPSSRDRLGETTPERRRMGGSARAKRSKLKANSRYSTPLVDAISPDDGVHAALRARPTALKSASTMW